MGNDYGLVSIIMPTYNSARFIRETILSVLNQGYENWEIIIVDNGSTDDTLKIASSFNDSRIHIFINEVNRGQTYSRNRAILESKGEWVAFLDSDDLWVPDKLEKQLAFMSQNGIHACYGNYIEINESGIENGFLVTGPDVVTERLFDKHYDYIGFLTAIYNQSYVGKISANAKIGSACADQALLYRVLQKCSFYKIDECLAKYRIVAGSPSHSGKIRSLKYQYIYYKIDRGFGLIRSCFEAVRKGFYYVFGKRIKYRKRYTPSISYSEGNKSGQK